VKDRGRNDGGTRAARGTAGRSPPDRADLNLRLRSAAEIAAVLEGDEELFLYTRYANPTVRESRRPRRLEGAEAGLALSSGMAAVTRRWRPPCARGRGSRERLSLWRHRTLLNELLPRFGVGGASCPRRSSRGSIRRRRSGAGLIVESPTNLRSRWWTSRRSAPRPTPRPGRDRRQPFRDAVLRSPRPSRPLMAQPDQGPRRPQRLIGCARRVAGEDRPARPCEVLGGAHPHAAFSPCGG